MIESEESGQRNRFGSHNRNHRTFVDDYQEKHEPKLLLVELKNGRCRYKSPALLFVSLAKPTAQQPTIQASAYEGTAPKF